MTLSTLHLVLAILVPIAFLIGGIPFGVLIAKRRGVDLKTFGSGNVGATNAGRALGKRFFFVVLALDALKALVPAAVASTLVHTQSTPDDRTALTFALWMAVGVSAVLGHVFSPFLGFKGGKGVACGLGLVLGTVPVLTLPGLVALAIFVAVFKVTRYISLGSMISAAVLPVAYVALALLLSWPMSTQWPVLAVLVLVALLVLWRHRDNLRRLRDGTEVAT
ncbi:MAG: glycerol-3-phosphate 1-O-acyltransferase PlsY [Planctomycetota bacterium]